MTQTYKLSGIEWLDQVPAHWSSKQLKYLAKVRPSSINKKSDPNEEGVRLCNYVDVYKNEYITAELPFMEATASREQIEAFTLKGGDVLATKDSETPDDIAVPAFVREPIDRLVCGYHLTLIRPTEELAGEYLFRLFQSKPFNSHFETAANGVTRYGLSIDAFTDARIPVPPYEEQLVIARFLYDKTTKIDQLIEKKRKMIELLREERQALINQAVTKGLDPNVKMKPSGIEWLGDVPEHWDVQVLKRVTKRIVVGIAEAATWAYRESGVPILRATNVKGGRIEGDLLFIDEDFARANSSKMLSANDLVTVRTGNAGQTAVVPESLNGCQCFTMLITSLNEKADPHFYNYYINSGPGCVYFDLTAWGTAQRNISVPILQAMHVPVPPISEVRSIVAFLDKKLREIDKVILTAERSIDLLTEYRSSLISEAVTGKLVIS